jgi:hypothetical protein
LAAVRFFFGSCFGYEFKVQPFLYWV